MGAALQRVDDEVTALAIKQQRHKLAVRAAVTVERKVLPTRSRRRRRSLWASQRQKGRSCRYIEPSRRCASSGGGQSMMKALGYTWRVLVNLFYVAIVLYVFDKLHGRHETTILVAVLGLIYVAIRTIATGQFHALFEIIKVLTRDLIRVRELLHDQSVEGHKLEFEEQTQAADRVNCTLMGSSLASWA
jgi:hypothetical protein